MLMASVSFVCRRFLMSMIDKHSIALNSVTSLYHEFLLRYKKLKKVFGFVEGKEDLSFYRGFIEQKISNDWIVELWPVGNKDKVIELYSTIDWNRFPKEQLMFFIDLDFSDYLDEYLPTNRNVYITDGYSIENNIVNRATCERVLIEILGLSSIPKNDLDKILDIFEEQLEFFAESMIEIMAWILYWKKSGEKPCLNDIILKHLYKIEKIKLYVIEKPNGYNDAIEYVHNQCNIQLNKAAKILPLKNYFLENDDYKMRIRGKYMFWFLIEFAINVHSEITSLSKSLKKAPKMHVNLSQSGGSVLIAPRCRVPESLDIFLNNTCCTYIGSVH